MICSGDSPSRTCMGEEGTSAAERKPRLRQFYDAHFRERIVLPSLPLAGVQTFDGQRDLHRLEECVRFSIAISVDANDEILEGDIEIGVAGEAPVRPIS